MTKITVNDNVYLVDPEALEKIESICKESLNSPFSRHPYGTHYYYIDANGHVSDTIETGSSYDNETFHAANYCTDYMKIYDRSLMEVFTRLLWRYGEEREMLIDPTADSGTRCWAVDWSEHGPYVALHIGRTPGAIYFKSDRAAEGALKDIVIPFIANHPGFRW